MKSERRHELQQDELAVQIEKVSESVKQNAATIIGVVIAVVAILSGGIWFLNQQASAKDQAFQQLMGSGAADSDPELLIAQYRQVAKDQVSPTITRQAWLRIGDTALQYLFRARSETEAPDPKKHDAMLGEAEAAFDKVLTIAGNDVTALGRAHMGLGVIAETRGEFDNARTLYEKITKDKKFERTGLITEAEYRLANMENWSQTITFPEPKIVVTPTDTSGTEATFDPTEIDVTTNPGLEDMTPVKANEDDAAENDETDEATETSGQ